MTPRLLKSAVYLPVTALAVLLIGAPSSHDNPPLIVYNASASVPIGWYRILPVTHASVGDLILMRTPSEVRDLADRRHYLPKSVPMLKHIAASSGDQVCATGNVIRINGRPVVTRQDHDRLGRLMPMWQGCSVLDAGQVFVLNVAAPYSFDSRYFGPIDASLIKGKALPL